MSRPPLRDRASCATCEFGEMTEHNDALMYCRRKAPTQTTHSNRAVFPVTGENEWCGDYREEIDG